MTSVITFGKPQDRTTPFMRGNIQLAFPFSVVDREMKGQPEEETVTKRHSVVVTISDVKVILWSLSAADMEKVLFEIGSRYVAEKVKTNSLPEEFEILMPMIGSSYPEKCPFSPSRIKAPDGAEILVEAERSAIGFKT